MYLLLVLIGTQLIFSPIIAIHISNTNVYKKQLSTVRDCKEFFKSSSTVGRTNWWWSDFDDRFHMDPTYKIMARDCIEYPNQGDITRKVLFTEFQKISNLVREIWVYYRKLQTEFGGFVHLVPHLHVVLGPGGSGRDRQDGILKEVLDHDFLASPAETQSIYANYSAEFWDEFENIQVPFSTKGFRGLQLNGYHLVNTPPENNIRWSMFSRFTTVIIHTYPVRGKALTKAEVIRKIPKNLQKKVVFDLAESSASSPMSYELYICIIIAVTAARK